MKIKIKNLFLYLLALIIVWGGCFGLTPFLFVEKTDAQLLLGINETFDNYNKKDHSNYSAFWDTENGRVSLHALANNSFTTWNWMKPTPQGHKFIDIEKLMGTTLVAISTSEMFRSTDSGATWSTVDFGVAGLTLTSIEETMVDGVMLYATGYLGGQGYVLSSSDSGATWSTTDLVTMSVNVPNSSAWSTGVAGVAVGNGGEIIYTGTAGTTWTDGVSGVATNLNAVTVSGGIYVAVGGTGAGAHTILTSADLGATWTERANTATGQFYGVDMNLMGVVVAVGESGVFISTDSGVSWAPTTTDPTTVPARAVRVGSGGFFVTDSVGKVHYTANNGLTWTSVQTFSTEGFSFDLYGLDFNALLTEGFVSGESGMVAKTLDGGATWTSVSSHISDYGLNTLSCADTTNCLAVGDYRVGKTADGGSSWTSVVNTDVNYGINYFDTGATGGFRYGSGGKIYSTSDAGATWVLNNTGTTGAENFYDFAEMAVYTEFWIAGEDGAGNGIIYHKVSSDPWAAQSITTTNTVTGISIMYNTSTSEFVGYAVTDAGEIFKTIDSGDHWTSQVSPTVDPLSDIYCYNLDTCYISKTTCTAGDYIKTTNGGTDWTQAVFPGGGGTCPYQKVVGLDGNHVGILAGDGFYYTVNAGTDWAGYATATAPLYPTYMSGLDFIQSNKVFISSNGTAGSETGGLISLSSFYAATQSVQSSSLVTAPSTIVTGVLTATDTLNGQTIDYYLSADGGSHWESITSGVEHTFTNTGTDLRWKATLTTAASSVTPTIETVYVQYTIDEGGGYTPPETPTMACNDGSDNDGDGKIDFGLDLGCTSGTDDDESGPYECSDSIDNDSNGQIDFPSDTGCSTATDDDESTLAQCSDTLDNDGDGKIDFPADSGCDSLTDNMEAGEVTTPPVLTAPIDNLISNNAVPEISGTTEQGAMTVEVYIDAVNVANIISSTEKIFTYTPATALGEGAHEIYVKSSGLESTKVTITVDTIAPQAPLISTASIKSQTVSGENVSAIFAVNGISYGDTKYVSLYFDNVLVDNIEPVNDAWTYEFPKSVIAGDYIISVKSLDSANNVSVLSSDKTVTVVKEELKLCENGIDDDGDTLVDLDDFGCSSGTDSSEDSEFTIRDGETKDIVLTQGLSVVNFVIGAALGFDVIAEDHRLTVDSVVPGVSAVLIFQSDPQRVELNIDQVKKVDVDADGVNDVEVRLNEALPNNRVIVAMKALPRPIIIPEKEVVEEPKDEVVPPDDKKPEPPQEPADGDAEPVAPADAAGRRLVEDAAAIEEVLQIANKNEWDKSAEERALEKQFEVEKILQSEVVMQAEDAVAKVLSSITGADLSEVQAQVKAVTRVTVETAKTVQKNTIDNPYVERINSTTNTPVLATATATSVAAVATVGSTGMVGANVLTYLQFLVSQAVMILARRKRSGFGQIYNSITKQPVDLAVIRVFNADTNRLVATKVTDKQGRYQLMLDPGKYKFIVEKSEYKFPSKLMQNAKSDGNFIDLYYGTPIEVTEHGVVSPAIALDPNRKLNANKIELRKVFLRKAQSAFTILGPVLSLSSFIINPHLWVVAIAVAQILLYYIFKRLGIGEKPKSWGIVRGAEDKHEINHSIVRVFDTKFNKLLETQVTDNKGRYAFLVGNQEYYMTADKTGYFQQRTERINLSGKEGFLTSDIVLKKHNLGKDFAKAEESGVPVTIRTELGRLSETEIEGIKKVVRPDDQKIQTDKISGVELRKMHEDYYNLDMVGKTA